MNLLRAPTPEKTAGAATAAAAGPDDKLAPILDKLPAGDYTTSHKLMGRLLDLGPDAIDALIERVGDFGAAEGVKPKYALHGLAVFAARPGAEKERRMVAGRLARRLRADAPDELKAFLCRQLQLCGGTAEIAALGRLLASDRLCEPATQALLAIGGDEAAATLRKALPKASGRPRMTIIQALGRLRDTSSAASLRKDARDAPWDIRLVALHALGNIGDPAAVDILLEAADSDPSDERRQATTACLLLGRRLAEDGRTRDAERVFRRLMAMRQLPDDVHDRCAALEGLARSLGPKAAADLEKAMESDNLWHRNAAARVTLDLARSLKKKGLPEADRLLDKILEATKEEAVLHEARLLRGGATG